MIITTLKDLILSQLKLKHNSIHGIKHWEYVERVGLLLADQTKTNKTVIQLFAYLHDCQRLNDDYDPDHGLRAAEYVDVLYKQGKLQINTGELETLKFTCRYHNDRTIKSADKTVQICWDSDRIDLTRIGVDPKTIVLETDEAKRYIEQHIFISSIG